MVGSNAEKDHSRRVGKNWLMIGLCGENQKSVNSKLWKQNCAKIWICMCESHIEIVDGLSHVELVYGADNDGGSGEEGEQEEEGEVEHHVANEPVKSLNGEIIPVDCGKQKQQDSFTQNGFIALNQDFQCLELIKNKVYWIWEPTPLLSMCLMHV